MEIIERIARVLAGQYLSRDTARRAGADNASIWVDENWTNFHDDAVAVLKTLRHPPASLTNDNDAALWELAIQSALGQSEICNEDNFKTPVTRDPILSDRGEQGIAQTGEEDPLSGIEDPIVAAAVCELARNLQTDAPDDRDGISGRCGEEGKDISSGIATTNFDSGFVPVDSSNGDLAPHDDHAENDSSSEIYRLRSLAAALADSVEICEAAARSGEEIFRPIFLDKAKDRKEMVNEFNARILALGGKIKGDSDYKPDFAVSTLATPIAHRSMMNALETHEASLRSLFLSAINEQSGNTEAFLATQYLVIQREEKALRQLRA
jgi:hypothetical protein